MGANAEEEPRYELRADTSKVAIRQGLAGMNHYRMRKIRMVGAGVFLGIAAHVIYLFIIVMLPVQESGAARLGERFASGW